MHNSYKGYEVMHVGLTVHNPYMWYEYLLTGGVAVHNSKIKDNVTQVLACDAQLLQSLQSFARGT